MFGSADVTLRDIATVSRGGNFQKKDFIESGYPCIHYGQMYTHFGIFATDVIKDVCSCTAWLGKDDVAVSGHTAIIHHNQNAKYMSYYFHTDHFFAQKKKLAHGTKVIEVTPDKLLDIVIPLPSMEEQERIVNILDRFDSLSGNMVEGIPAEIEARQKQYEYYRDKLLSFKEKKCV